MTTLENKYSDLKIFTSLLYHDVLVVLVSFHYFFNIPSGFLTLKTPILDYGIAGELGFIGDEILNIIVPNVRVTSILSGQIAGI